MQVLGDLAKIALTWPFGHFWSRSFAPKSAAWEDSHRPQSLKRCRAFDENLFNIFELLTRSVVETVYIYMTNWYCQSLWYSENGIALAQSAFLYIIFF